MTILKDLKTWYHYLEDYKYEIFILTNYTNIQQFLDKKFKFLFDLFGPKTLVIPLQNQLFTEKD